jgi:uncharacterized protein involved in cysteine biosynthesis
MPASDPSHNLSDTLLAGGLVAAPAWANWLSEVNQILTTLSLIVGLTFAFLRLWYFLRDRCQAPRR